MNVTDSERNTVQVCYIKRLKYSLVGQRFF